MEASKHRSTLGISSPVIFCLMQRSKLQTDKKPAATNDANQDNRTNVEEAENKD